MDDEGMTTQSALTTIDNPYDPFDDYDNWYAYDLAHGYGTLALLARIIVTSNELSDADEQVAYDSAVDEIANENVSGIHLKVTRQDGSKG